MYEILIEDQIKIAEIEFYGKEIRHMEATIVRINGDFIICSLIYNSF